MLGRASARAAVCRQWPPRAQETCAALGESTYGLVRARRHRDQGCSCVNTCVDGVYLHVERAGASRVCVR